MIYFSLLFRLLRWFAVSENNADFNVTPLVYDPGFYNIFSWTLCLGTCTIMTFWNVVQFKCWNLQSLRIYANDVISICVKTL